MIIHSPVISGSLTFADGATFTLPDNGIYSGSFSGSLQVHRVQSDLIPDVSGAYDLGSETFPFQDLWLTGNTINIGGIGIGVGNTLSGGPGLNIKNKSTNNPVEIAAKSITIGGLLGGVGTKSFKLNDNGNVELQDESGSIDTIEVKEIVLKDTSGNGKNTKIKNDGGKFTTQEVNDSGSVTSLDSEGSLSGSFTGSVLDLVATGNAVFNDSISVSGVSTFAAISSSDMDVSGHIIPSVHNTYDLGSTTKYWRDLYLSSGSLYINGVQVLSTSGTDFLVQTDAGENFKIQETGADTITLEADNGDITLTTTGNGNIELDAPIQIGAGKQIISSDGNAIQFGEDLAIQGFVSASGRVSSDNIGNSNGTSTFTGSFVGDGSGLTGLATLLTVDDASTTQDVDLLADDLQFLGTANEITTAITKVGTDVKVTIGLPDDVTIGNGLNVGGNAVITGNLTVSGTTTTVNSNTVNIGDNQIVLNSDETGTPSQNGGIAIERGTSTNASLIWNETNDYWMSGLLGAEERIVVGAGNTSITTLGTITTGVWNGTAITHNYIGLDAIDGTNIADNSINSEHYVDGSIDRVHLVADIIDGTKIADDAVNSEHIANGAIDLAHMSANSVDSDQYVDGSIDRVHLAADIIDGTKIADDAVNSEHIADGAIDNVHLAGSIAASKITEISNLTAAEGAQLENIGTTTISATQWGYLGVMNQNVRTTDNVTFGNINGATGTFTGDVIAYASSDERLKDNIEVISNPIEKVQQLKGVTWDWNDNASDVQKSLPNVGVIAQDVEKVLPQLVKDRDNGFKGVDYDKIVGLLIEAIKDQQKQIDDLKSKI